MVCVSVENVSNGTNMVCVSVENVSNGMVVQMRVATERAKLVRGITASFKKLSRSSEISLACHALPEMTLHCSESHCSDQAALMPAACSCASLQRSFGQGKKASHCARVAGASFVVTLSEHNSLLYRVFC